MKIFVKVLAVVAALGILAGVTGCDDPQADYIRGNYEYCVSHGGSWHYDGGNGSQTCDHPTADNSNGR